MEKIGGAESRNEEFKKKYNRELVIKSTIIKENPVCFDVGAHQGESVLFLNKIFKEPFVYSFEPFPDSFKILKNKKFKNNLCFNYAVSNSVGSSKFFVNEISHTNSLIKVNPSSIDSIKKQKIINTEINIKTITLDDFIFKENIDTVDLLKIDVQGAESLVLEGGQNFLSKVEIIIIEICFFDYYNKSSDFFEVEKFLKPKGFSLFTISEISYNPMNGRTDWVEAIYRKDI
jgi:FkbM family methyltransferase